MELPVYRMPRWSNVGITIFNKARTFVMEAGKVILAVSIILWVLATFGPSKDFDAIETKYAKMSSENTTVELNSSTLESKKKAEKFRDIPISQEVKDKISKAKKGKSIPQPNQMKIYDNCIIECFFF